MLSKITENVEYLLEAATKGNVNAVSRLAYLISEKFVKIEDVKNQITAILWYFAAKENNATAIGNLGWAYKHGLGVERDIEKAAKYYARAIELENLDFVKDLYNIYDNTV